VRRVEAELAGLDGMVDAESIVATWSGTGGSMFERATRVPLS
jgi:hypothetical protein